MQIIGLLIIQLVQINGDRGSDPAVFISQIDYSALLTLISFFTFPVSKHHTVPVSVCNLVPGDGISLRRTNCNRRIVPPVDQVPGKDFLTLRVIFCICLIRNLFRG